MIGDHEGYLTVGLYPDGKPGEIFLTLGKAGSTLADGSFFRMGLCPGRAATTIASSLGS